MNKEILLHNIEIIRQYLNMSGAEFSKIFGKENSYYRACRKRNSIPDLDFIVKMCKYCHINLERFLNEKLKINLAFENDYDLKVR